MLFREKHLSDGQYNVTIGHAVNNQHCTHLKRVSKDMKTLTKKHDYLKFIQPAIFRFNLVKSSCTLVKTNFIHKM